MARPRTISDEQILEAARGVFLEHGYQASTSQVASAAGISEGTIYKRFETKEKLFVAAMGMHGFKAAESLQARVGEGEVQDNLEQVATKLIEFFLEMLPRTHQLFANCSFDAVQHLKGNPDAPPIRVLKALTAYLDGEMRLGRLRVADAEIVARTLVAACHSYAFMEIVGVNSRMPFAMPSYVRGLVDLVWQGVSPSQSAS